MSFSAPLSMYSIPALWVLAYYPFYKKLFVLSRKKAWNNVNPRSNTARFSEQKNASPDLAKRVAQMDGAHQNGLEALYFFGLAILAGNSAGLPHETLNKVAGFFIAARMLYNYIYLNQSNQFIAGLRSAVWLVSNAAPFYLLFKSAFWLQQRA